MMSLSRTGESDRHRPFANSTHTDKSLDAAIKLKSVVRHKKTERLLDYYIDIHPGSCLPGRADINPMAIPTILSNITLMDVQKKPCRFKYRVAGSSIYDQWGIDPTGLYLDEFMGSSVTIHPYIDRKTVLKTGLPVYRYGLPDIEFLTSYANMEYLHLPLASDGTNVDMILSSIIYLVDA